MGTDIDIAGKEEGARKVDSTPIAGRNGNLDNHGIYDETIIPTGALDPVYEAKARVLNHAVGGTPPLYRFYMDPDVWSDY